jgi:hypothetical protein
LSIEDVVLIELVVEGFSRYQYRGTCPIDRVFRHNVVIRLATLDELAIE